MTDARSRIVFNGKFLSAEPTGVHRVAEELVLASAQLVNANPLLKNNFQFEVWIPPNGREKAEQLGIPFRVVSPLTGIPWEQLALPVFARSTPVINLCNVGPMLHRNSITMFHDAQVHISPQSYSRAFRLWYGLHQPIGGRRHRRILTVSNFSKEELARCGIAPADRIDVVHNGVDHVLKQTADHRILARHALLPQRFVVGLANTQRHKNIRILLRTFASGALDDLKLVLVGSAKAQDFQAMGEPTPPNVIFAGRVSDEELRALYGNALALCFPSLTEGFGLPPLEAMIAGCPAIVAPNGALPEVCGKYAIYSDPQDPQAWASSIHSLDSNPRLRQKLSASGEAHARTFTWDRAARQLLASIFRTLNGKHCALAETMLAHEPTADLTASNEERRVGG